MDLKEILKEIENLETEKKKFQLDELDYKEIVSLSINDNIYGLLKVREHIGEVVKVANMWAKALRGEGRVVMVGAGTSGRLAIMESAEMFPTFGISRDRVLGFIAGGKNSVFASKEGAEDSIIAGKRLVKRLKLSKKDLLIGLSASGRTPYVKGAIDMAKVLNCPTALISTNPKERVLIKADVNICVNVGSEILPGSTRMKSATVQKVILNTISLLGAVILGRVKRGRMVDLVPTSGKLRARAIKTLVEEFSLEYDEAVKLLEKTGWNLRLAFEIMEGKDADNGRKV
ncbi:MAG: N-acetylmuramic acid 6-phosphate etherase [candidate division WOR-3 bacterium]